MKNPIRLLTMLLLTVSIVGLSACGSTQQPSASAPPAQTPAPTTAAQATDASAPPPAAEPVSAEPAASRTINIGYNGGLCQAPVAIAYEKGFFAEEGLDAKLTRADVPRDAIAAGKLDTSAGMVAAWLKPITNGVDIVFTVGLHTGCTSALVLADSPINGFADAKGGAVGISGGIGGVNHNIAYRFLAHDELKPDDFTWKDFSEDQLLLILQKGEADIVIAGDQLAEKWVQEGLVKRIRSTTLDEDFANETCCILGISGAFIKENPQTAEKISRAIYKAGLWVQENKLETAQILIDKGHISGTPEYAASLLELYKFDIPNSQAIESIYTSVDEYKQLGVIAEDVDVEKLKDQIWHPYDLDAIRNEK